MHCAEVNLITVKDLREMFSKCPDDWNVEFLKWEHGNPEDFKKKYPSYPIPNLVSVKVKKVVTTANKEHEWIIHKFVLEDDFDDVFSLTRDEALEYFCWGLADDEMIGFELNVGNNINVSLSIEEGDKGHTDKKMIFTFEEK